MYLLNIEYVSYFFLFNLEDYSADIKLIYIF